MEALHFVNAVPDVKTRGRLERQRQLVAGMIHVKHSGCAGERSPDRGGPDFAWPAANDLAGVPYDAQTLAGA